MRSGHCNSLFKAFFHNGRCLLQSKLCCKSYLSFVLSNPSRFQISTPITFGRFQLPILVLNLEKTPHLLETGMNNIFIHNQQSHCIPFTTIKHHTYEEIIRKLPPGPQHSLLSPAWFQPALHQGSSFPPCSTDHIKFIFSD